MALYLNKLKSHTTQGCFGPSLIEIDPVVLEKKMKMWKVYRQTDSRRSEKVISTFCFSELKIIMIMQLSSPHVDRQGIQDTQAI